MTGPVMDVRPAGRVWLAGRAALALALLAGFYVLVLLVAAALLWLAYAQVAYVRFISPKLLLLTAGGAVLVLWAAIPRRERFVPPGPSLSRADAPALFTLIDEVAAATGQPVPEDVYLIGDVNAFVSQRGTVMGFGGRRVMGVGLPLLQSLNVQELKAILAHEFGHYHAGDVALGPLIYRTRASLGRMIAQLSGSALQRVFVAYAGLFVRVTHAISRRQEYIADEVSASVAGSDAAVDALRKVHRSAMAFQGYWRQEVAPLLGSGYLPPIIEGFATYVGQPDVASDLDRAVEKMEAAGQTDPADTHPALRDRVAALRARPRLAPSDARAAGTLVPSLDRWERQLLGISVNEDWAKGLRPLAWGRALDAVHLPRYREHATQHAALLAPFTIGTPPVATSSLARLGRSMGIPSADLLPEPAKVQMAAGLLAQAVVVALVDAGWTASTSPGETVVLRRGDARIEPFPAFVALADGSRTLTDWTAECEAAGIAGLPLAPPASPIPAQ